MISKIKNDLYDIRSEDVPYVEREYHLKKKEFDYSEPEIEITYDDRIPSPFIRSHYNEKD